MEPRGYRVSLQKKKLMVLLLKMYADKHTKRQVHKMHLFKMFITAVCIIFLIKPKTKSLYDILFRV